MIRVNLMKSRGGDQQEETTSLNYSYGGEYSESSKKEAIFKIFLIFVFSVGLIFYEQYSEQESKKEALLAQRKLNQLIEKVNQKRKHVSDAQETQKRIIEFQKKIKILRELARDRLREVKSLDYLQTVIPDPVWLKHLSYSNNSVTFKGLAKSDVALMEFVNELEQKSYFDSVIMTQAISDPSKAGVIDFSISSQLGKEQ